MRAIVRSEALANSFGRDHIDREHMDCYRNMRDVKKTFLEFMDRVPFYGMVVVCNDDPMLRRCCRRRSGEQ